MEIPGIVLARRGQPPTLEQVELLEPGPGEVLVRMVASGICHTDIGYMEYARACPVILGHEGAGVVESVGPGSSGVKPGDHVVINWQPKCGKCKACLAGRRDLCEDIQATAAPRLFWQGQPLNVMLNAGTFSPYVVIPAAGAVSIRKDMPFEKAALLGCAVATGVGAVFYTSQVHPGEAVVVLGAGGVGLNIVQAARLVHAGPIFAVDRDAQRLALAKKLGATHTIHNAPSQASGKAQVDALRQVMDWTGGRGAEHVFEVVGRPDLMQLGIEMLARGGTLTLVGAAGREEVLPLYPRRFMSMQQKLVGCIYGNIRPELDLPMFADWYMQGKLKLDELHTHTIPLEDVPEVFVHSQEGEGIRTVVRFA